MANNFTLDLGSIKDPGTKRALKLLLDQAQLAAGGTTAPAWKGPVNAAGQPLTNLADATEATQAVTLQQLEAATSIKTIATKLQNGGTQPLNVTNLVGAGGQITMGTHVQRLAATATAGNWFYETNRNALYAANTAGQWIHVASAMFGTSADKPTDLTSNDTGFQFLQQGYNDGNIIWIWTDSALADKWWAAIGQQNGHLSDIPPATVKLYGTYYYATDYDRMYFCGAGPAWQDAPGQPARNLIGLFDIAPGTGWARCDGSNATFSNATFSTAAAATTTRATPDITTLSNYLVGGPALGNGTITGTAGAGFTINYQVYLPYIRL